MSHRLPVVQHNPYAMKLTLAEALSASKSVDEVLQALRASSHTYSLSGIEQTHLRWGLVVPPQNPPTSAPGSCFFVTVGQLPVEWLHHHHKMHGGEVSEEFDFGTSVIAMILHALLGSQLYSEVVCIRRFSSGRPMVSVGVASEEAAVAICNRMHKRVLVNGDAILLVHEGNADVFHNVALQVKAQLKTQKRHVFLLTCEPQQTLFQGTVHPMPPCPMMVVPLGSLRGVEPRGGQPSFAWAARVRAV